MATLETQESGRCSEVVIIQRLVLKNKKTENIEKLGDRAGCGCCSEVVVSTGFTEFVKKIKFDHLFSTICHTCKTLNSPANVSQSLTLKTITFLSGPGST